MTGTNNSRRALLQLLRDHDPVHLHEDRAELQSEIVAEIKESVLTETRRCNDAPEEVSDGLTRSGRRSASLIPAFAVACTVVLVGVALAYSWTASSGRREAPAALHQSSELGRSTQVNFVTPGGTRVIWQLTEDLDL